MTWMAAATALGAGASIYSTSQQGKGGNNQAGHGFDTWIAPQWDFTEGNMNRLSDTYNADLSRNSAGQLPAGYENFLNPMEAQQRKRLYQQYFGNGGTEPGLMQGSMDAGAVMGLGPKQGMAQTQKVYNDYRTQASQIDDMINQYKLGVFSGARNSALSGMAGLSQGPTSQPITWQQSASGGDGGAGLMGTLGGMLGGGKGGGFDISKIFGKTTTPSYGGGGGIIGSQGPQGNAFSQYQSGGNIWP